MRILIVVAMVMATLAGGTGCGDGDNGEPKHGHGAHDAVETQESDWQPVADILGRRGLLWGGNVYKIWFPRTDIVHEIHGVRVKPGLGLGSWVSFARMPDGSTMLMGDLVATESEIGAVTDALQAGGMNQTALHKHLPDGTVSVWWTHVHGHGDVRALARTVRSALDATATPPDTSSMSAAPYTSDAPPLDLDAAGINGAIRLRGLVDGDVYRFLIGRRDRVTDTGMVLLPAMGMATQLNFQPTGGGKAAVTGDFAMIGSEVQKVIRALRTGGLTVVEVHNHGLTEEPRMFFAHFWAEGDAVAIARTLRSALDVLAV